MTKVFLDLNADQLSGAQKQVADEYRAEIEAQQRALDAQEAERKGVLDIALRAASNGASNATINAILQAQTQEAAISTAGSSLAKKSGTGEGNINLSSTNRTSLLGAGFTQGEVAQIENDVRNFGMDAVLEGMSTEQQNAIRDAYGVESNNQFLSRDYFSSLFTEDQLKKEAEKEGFMKTENRRFRSDTQAVDTDAYLDSVEATINAYRTAGFTDKEILKIMR